MPKQIIFLVFVCVTVCYCVCYCVCTPEGGNEQMNMSGGD